MTLEAWLVFVVAETLLCIAPGPAVFLVVSTGLARGTEASAYASLGVLAANTAYFVLSVVGVGALIVASHEAFVVIRWLGVAYLAWIGISTFLGTHPTMSIRPGEADSAQRPKRARIFRTGLLMKLSDPKTLIYFVALLPQFIDPAGSLGLQIAILAVTSVVIELGVLLGYGVLAGRLAPLARRPSFATWANRVAGGFLMAAAAGMATLRRAQ